MIELLFDAPWYLVAGIAATGLGLFIWGNNRLRKDVSYTGLGVIGLALVVLVTSYLVNTPREKAETGTRAFADAVVAQDTAAMDRLLDRSARAYRWGRQEIMDGAVHYAQQTGLKGARIMRVESQEDPYGIVTFLSIWSQHDSGKFPVSDLTSQWKFIWQREGQDWRIREIIPLQIGQVPGERIQQEYLDRPTK